MFFLKNSTECINVAVIMWQEVNTIMYYFLSKCLTIMALKQKLPAALFVFVNSFAFFRYLKALKRKKPWKHESAQPNGNLPLCNRYQNFHNSAGLTQICTTLSNWPTLKPLAGCKNLGQLVGKKKRPWFTRVNFSFTDGDHNYSKMHTRTNTGFTTWC